MLRLAICDDDEFFCAETEKHVKSFQRSSPYAIEITRFISGDALLRAVSEGKSFDLLFLDIEMSGLNGVEVGRKLREQKAAVQIVYVSGKSEYAMELFQNRPLDFLIKPVTEAKIFASIETYLNVFGYGKSFYQFSHRKGFHSISVSDIMYFESCGRELHIHTVNGPLTVLKKISEVTTEPFAEGFLLIHKSYFINKAHIRSYHFEYVVMTDGACLSISRSRRSEIRSILVNSI